MAPKVVPLDTERPRDIAANEVLAKFAEFTEDLSVQVGRMSGFWVVVFDDEGNPMTSMYMGERFPLPLPMVPDIVRECCTNDVYDR